MFPRMSQDSCQLSGCLWLDPFLEGQRPSHSFYVNPF